MKPSDFEHAINEMYSGVTPERAAELEQRFGVMVRVNVWWLATLNIADPDSILSPDDIHKLEQRFPGATKQAHRQALKNFHDTRTYDKISVLEQRFPGIVAAARLEAAAAIVRDPAPERLFALEQLYPGITTEARREAYNRIVLCKVSKIDSVERLDNLFPGLAAEARLAVVKDYFAHSDSHQRAIYEELFSGITREAENYHLEHHQAPLPKPRDIWPSSSYTEGYRPPYHDR